MESGRTLSFTTKGNGNQKIWINWVYECISMLHSQYWLMTHPTIDSQLVPSSGKVTPLPLSIAIVYGSSWEGCGKGTNSS